MSVSPWYILYVFFGEMSIQGLCPFLNVIVFYIELSVYLWILETWLKVVALGQVCLLLPRTLPNQNHLEIDS